MQKPTRKVAPDGGWGWVACFGVSLVNVSTDFPLEFFRMMQNSTFTWNSHKYPRQLKKITKRKWKTQIQQVARISLGTFTSPISQHFIKLSWSSWNSSKIESNYAMAKHSSNHCAIEFEPKNNWTSTANRFIKLCLGFCASNTCCEVSFAFQCGQSVCGQSYFAFIVFVSFLVVVLISWCWVIVSVLFSVVTCLLLIR